jgi:replicative DNA helicase
MLKPVPKTDDFKGAISEATNYTLEAELIGQPLWLWRNGHEAEALDVAAFIAKQPRELFVRHIHRVLASVYDELCGRGLPLSDGLIQQVAHETGKWSQDEANGAAITPGLVDELTEAGSCKCTLAVGDSAMSLAQEIARELWGLYRKRRVIHATEDLLALVTNWNPGIEPDIAEGIEAVQTAFNERPVREETASSLHSLVEADIEKLERQLAGEEPERILTGFPSLDRILGGIQPGNLIVLAGRPSMGKSALALDMGLNLIRDDRVIAFFSFEMTREELIRRLASKICRINVLRLRHGSLESWQFDQYRNTAQKIANLPLIIDEGNFTPTGIERRIRDFNRMLTHARVEFVIIDHLQLMGTGDITRYERRDRQLATYTGQLKDMAKRLGIPVLLLSQLNRQSANRPQDEKLPRLSDLRESGSIEQDADAVIGIYRKFPDTQNPADESHADIVVLKNRSGPTGKISLEWVPTLAMFIDPSHESHGGLEDAPF